MDSVNKTLYIPLYGKALVSRKGILLQDRKAEEIWEAEGFTLRGKAKSKWLAYNMGMRSAVFDNWLREKMEQIPNAVVIHAGCGMDSRVERVKTNGHLWFDLDFPEVIDQRKRYYRENEEYKMIASDLRDQEWLSRIEAGSRVILVMEGVSMYLSRQELCDLLAAMQSRFATMDILMDCYTEFGAKASKYKNPVNEVGVTQLYGLDDPNVLGIPVVREHDLTPQSMIDELHGFERAFFETMFAGSVAKKIYRLYEFSC